MLGLQDRVGVLVAENFVGFGFRGYGVLNCDRYDADLKQVSVCDLIGVAERADICWGVLSQAVWAYLNLLNPNDAVVLYWH